MFSEQLISFKQRKWSLPVTVIHSHIHTHQIFPLICQWNLAVININKSTFVILPWSTLLIPFMKWHQKMSKTLQRLTTGPQLALPSDIKHLFITFLRCTRVLNIAKCAHVVKYPIHKCEKLILIMTYFAFAGSMLEVSTLSCVKNMFDKRSFLLVQ